MFLNTLSINNYKSFSSAKFNFEKKINCFIGKNGVGKSNIIDSIYHLAFTKSYFNPSSNQNIKIGSDFFSINGEFLISERKEEILCSFKKGEKKRIKRNGKIYKKISDHIGLVNLIIISPHDRNLIAEGSEMRRKFIDSVIGQIDKVYLKRVMDYNKILTQRNSLLKYFFINKKFDQNTIDAYDQQLISLGTPIYTERNKFLKLFIPIFKKYYNNISSGDDSVNIKYNSHLNEGSFTEIISSSISKDRFVQYTTKGIHKDDLEFLIEGNKIKNFGSQGQQKSFLVSLKLAQFEYYKEKFGSSPIVLLDDIFDKLDQNRVTQIVNILEKNEFGQIFITDTHRERVEEALKHSSNKEEIFNIE
jgi:DNA replication and repair protein RecF